MQAYEFFQSFFDTYGPGGLEQFFGYRHQYFIEALTTRQSYGNGPFQASCSACNSASDR